jgi:hypothetical protein
MTVSSLAAEPAARFTEGEDATLLVTAAADPGYLGGAAGALGLRLPGGRVIVAAPQWPGVTMIHGDIRPTLIQALRHAIEQCSPCACGCGTGQPGWVDQYEKALDVLEAGE